MTPEPSLLADQPADGVLRLRLNRPERRNALSTPLLQSIADALEEVGTDISVRAVLITGCAKVFAAGADIDEVAAADANDPVESLRFKAWARIRAFEKPLVAAVEGWCLGAGAELAMCCDLIVAAESAKIGLPETKLGIIPGAGGTATLARLVGRALAMRMVLTGQPITASQAFAAGLIAEVVPTGDAEVAGVDLAQLIAARAPLAIRAAKASIRRATELHEVDHIRWERERFVELLGTADKKDGIAAFRNKRAPVWSGT